MRHRHQYGRVAPSGYQDRVVRRRGLSRGLEMALEAYESGGRAVKLRQDFARALEQAEKRSRAIRDIMRVCGDQGCWPKRRGG